MNYQKLFLEANYNWDVNRLHKVIALHRHKTISKRENLTDLEATILRGLLCDLTPQEIACHFHKEFYIIIINVTKNLFQDLLIIAEQQDKSFGNIIQCLTAAGYKKLITDEAVIVRSISKSISRSIPKNTAINQFVDRLPATQINNNCMLNQKTVNTNILKNY